MAKLVCCQPFAYGSSIYITTVSEVWQIDSAVRVEAEFIAVNHRRVIIIERMIFYHMDYAGLCESHLCTVSPLGPR